MIDIHEMSVLIVDDAQPMCKALQKMLRVIGYGKKFFLANNGKDALRILEKETIDLILLDYNMPVMNGAETIGHIRENRKLRDIPAIMITAEAYKEFVTEVGESGVDAYLLKPLTIKLLEEKISLVIEKANNPSPMIYHLKQARNFKDEGDMDSAIKEASLAMAADPNSSRPMRDLGYYHFKNGDLKTAETFLLKAAKMNNLDVFAFHYLGELYFKCNDIKKAQHYFGKAMEISPRHIDRGITFGKVLVQMKMNSRAAQVFDKALSLSGSTLELKEEIADFCSKEGVLEYSLKILKSILKEQPDRKGIYLKLGKISEKNGDIADAVTYLINGENVEKENMDIKIQLAKCYLTLKKPVFAEKALNRALEIDPDNPSVRALLVKCV